MIRQGSTALRRDAAGDRCLEGLCAFIWRSNRWLAFGRKLSAQLSSRPYLADAEFLEPANCFIKPRIFKVETIPGNRGYRRGPPIRAAFLADDETVELAE
jgi:hypothetical protein